MRVGRWLMYGLILQMLVMGIGLAEEGSEEVRRDTGRLPWGVATFASGCLCQSPLEHGGDGSNRHWQP